MKPARFAYRRAGSIDEALTWLADGQTEPRILAGGQSLVPLLNMRLARPAMLVDVNRIREHRPLLAGLGRPPALPGSSYRRARAPSGVRARLL